MVAGVAGYSSLVFAMIPPGLISLAGCIRVIICLKDHSPYRMYGIALAVVIAGGILTGVVYLPVSAITRFPGDPLVIATPALREGLLMALAPCAVLLRIACSPFIEGHIAYWVVLAMTVIISLLPRMLFGDLLLAMFHVTTAAYFVHPWWEGLMMLYGIAGSPFIGAIPMLISIRIPGGSCPQSSRAPGLPEDIFFSGPENG